MPRSVPRRKVLRSLSAVALLLASACDHSESFTTPDTRNNGPLVPGPLAQLTFNQRPDRAPVIGPDSGAVVYAFETGAADRDICLAALPVTGGTRLGEWCATDAGEASRADLFAAGALSSDGRLAYTQHSSLVFAPVPSAGALYLAPGGNTAARVKVLDLLRPYPGLNGTVDFLLDPVWTGPDELMALATNAQIARACDGCPWDTTYVGQAIVRISPSVPNAMQVVAPAAGATQIAYDASLRRFAIRVGRQILVVPAAGGTPELAYDADADASLPPRSILGMAAGGGRLFLTRTWSTPENTLSEIARVESGSAVQVANTQLSADRWRRATATADGRRLIVERFRGSTGDIDLWSVEVTP